MSELPPGWVEATVDEITSYVSRGKSPKYTDKSRLPVVNQKAIRWHGIQNEHLKYVHEDQFDQWTAERFIQAGDILWNSTGTGTIGRACLVRAEHLDPPKVVDSHVTIVRPIPEVVDPRFLFAWVRGPEVQNGLEELATGSTNQIELNRSTVVSTRVPVAPLPEQKRIADKLDALLARVDACRQRLDRVPGILKRFRQSVLAAATSGELTREWREERGLAKEWTETRVEEIAFVGTGSTPLRSNGAFYAETGTPWITSAMTGLPFVTRAEEFVTEAAIVAHRLKRYPVGTLLVAMYGEGKTRGQVTELRIEATINQACAAISVDARKATTPFVRLALEANYLQMRELAEGGNQPNLNLSKIKEFPLSLPCLEEQQAITARVEAIYEWVGRIETRLSAARRHVDRSTRAALAKAFRGELVPQNPNDEPASELLARLRARLASAGDTGKPKRGGARGPRTKAKANTNMLTRKDVTPTHLTTILKERGSLTAEALWTASQLEIDDFYDQLKDEAARGLLRENRGDSPTAARVLEAAA